jgi:uncharacterized membrane protein YgcG
MKTTVIVAILIGVAVIGLLWWSWIAARARRRAYEARVRERYARDRARVSERFEHHSEAHHREGQQPRSSPSRRRGGFFGGGGGGGPRPQ